MSPVQALELIRGLAAPIQETSPEAQREVVLRVFRRIAIRDDQVVDVEPGLRRGFQVVFTTPSGLGAQIPPVLLKYV